MNPFWSLAFGFVERRFHPTLSSLNECVLKVQYCRNVVVLLCVVIGSLRVSAISSHFKWSRLRRAVVSLSHSSAGRADLRALPLYLQMQEFSSAAAAQRSYLKCQHPCCYNSYPTLLLVLSHQHIFEHDLSYLYKQYTNNSSVVRYSIQIFIASRFTRKTCGSPFAVKFSTGFRFCRRFHMEPSEASCFLLIMPREGILKTQSTSSSEIMS